MLKTLDQFDWDWPTKINRLMIQNLFHLEFVKQHANVVFISSTGLGKSHLMTALGYAACQRGHSVLFTGAVEIINTLAQALRWPLKVLHLWPVKLLHPDHRKLMR